MFDLLPMLLSSVASFLFPIFASYKALKSSDPAQLTAWLMYWVVISCFLLAESWVYFIVSWIPFYGYFRLLFLLYLILPQTQGARFLYEEKIHPYLEENESQIDEFITSAHNRLTDAGIAYLKLAIEAFKTKVLGLPPSEPSPPTSPGPTGPQSYTQSLLSRFSVPAARWTGSAASGPDLYNLLSSYVAAATSSGAQAASGPASTATSSATATRQGFSSSSTLIPSHLRDSDEKMTFISAQRDRLNFILSALDREAQSVRADAQRAQQQASAHRRAPSMSYDGIEDDEPTQRPSSIFGAAGLTKSRSEADFEKIDAESDAEDDPSLRRRHVPPPGPGGGGAAPAGGWMPWSWGAGNAQGGGTSSGVER